jgi:hypothetical protein
MSICRPPRTLRLVVLASMLVLTLTASASASQGRDIIRLTRQGQAAARAVVLTKADFGFATGWTGGAVKPDPSSRFSCKAPGANPLTSETNGDQSAEFSNTGVRVTSEVRIRKTSAMVRGDWKSAAGPHTIACLRAEIAKSLKPNERIISVKPRSFPHVATYTQAYRVLMTVPIDGGTGTYAVDFIHFGRGRTEASLATLAPLSPLLNAFEAHLARAMATRITV